ncbi:type II secretion system protein [Labedella phragmitis]|uniref:Type II secretion system protein n=1 Tax=Labedella phragmitis TaxID=2498849 RepID=A0A3S3Z229_9MICO|nr:type II secretion system protein [Labedella phragmitis]RWZ50034.1 type II secretion system protein [Labedella phragmitis]
MNPSMVVRAVAARMVSVRRVAQRDEGISLVELVVGILVLGIISALIANLFISSVRAMSVSSATDTNTRMASNGMNQLTRMVRAGTPYPVKNEMVPRPAFVQIAPDSFTMYAYVNLQNSDQKPVKVQYSVERTDLIETTWEAGPPDGDFYNFPPDPTSRRELATSLVPAAETGSPLFTYLDKAGHPIAVPSGGVISTDVLASVSAVSIALTIQGSSTDTRSRVALENTVAIPNLGRTRVIP